MLNDSSLLPTIFYGALLLFMLGSIAALWMRMGNVQQELGGLQRAVADLREESQTTRTELREGLQATRADLREELQKSMTDFREQLQTEMRSNHRQLMLALLNHSHADDGRPFFNLPPDFAATPADDA